MKARHTVIWLFGLLFLFGCEDEPQKKKNVPLKKDKQADLIVPSFNGDSAYAFIEQQLAFGPRVPGTAPHRACGDWMVEKLESYGAKVVQQNGEVQEKLKGGILPCRNIIASINPSASRRIMLSAHWDTRPVADADDERADEPIPGANDGGSGVAVLLEVARKLQGQNPPVGVDLFFWDVEDYGNTNVMDSYCLGSQYWGKKPHVAGYQALYNINLDMVGAAYARFPREGVSLYFARHIVDKVWRIANEAGYGIYFSYDEDFEVTDDHLYVNQLANIPAIDIIDHRLETDAFFDEWHTHEDDIDAISKETLKAVGQTMLEVIFREQ